MKIRKYIVRAYEAIFGYLLLYIGDWHFVTDISVKTLTKLGFSEEFMIKEWGGQMLKSLFDLLVGEKPSFLSGKHSFLININDSYYGFICGKKFFDSPFIQWIILVIAIFCMIDGLFNLILKFRKKDSTGC